MPCAPSARVAPTPKEKPRVPTVHETRKTPPARGVDRRGSTTQRRKPRPNRARTYRYHKAMLGSNLPPASRLIGNRRWKQADFLLCHQHRLAYLRRRFRVSSDIPTANAFCRTAPSERRSLRAICRTDVRRAVVFRQRRSCQDQSRRTRLLVVAISHSI